MVTLRGAVTGLALAALAATYLYALTSVEPGEPVLFGWAVGRLEWLWLLSFVVLGYAAWPLATDRSRTVRYVRRLSRNSVATVAALYLLIFFLTGTLGPVLLSPPEPSFVFSNLPPVGFSVSNEVASGCAEAGRVVGDTCFGSLRYPLGTTRSGQGLLGLIVFGSRLVVQIAMIMAALVVPLATAAGALAAGYGGRVDDLVTTVVDVERTVPALLVFLVVRLLVGSGTVFMLVVIFGLINAGAVASVVRSRALDEVQEEYVMAARAAGASRLEVIRDHLMPNVSHVALTAVVLQIPTIVVTEATLSYIQVGSTPGPILTTPPSLISWGKLIANNIDRVVAVWWPVVFPVLALFVTVLALNVFGEGLRQAFAPEAR